MAVHFEVDEKGIATIKNIWQKWSNIKTRTPTPVMLAKQSDVDIEAKRIKKGIPRGLPKSDKWYPINSGVGIFKKDFDKDDNPRPYGKAK